jgi:hypothetical protein
VRKKKQAKWWHLRREHWILRAGIQANQRIYKPQTEADAVWGNLPWGPKDDLAREFINRLTPDIEGYSTRFHKGIIIKEGNGYLVHSGARGEPDNVAIKLLRMVGLPAKAFGTTDESPPMPST